MKDVIDVKDIDDALSVLPVSDNRQKQISNIIQYAVSNANPGNSTTFFNSFK